MKNTVVLTFSLAAAYFCTGYFSNFLLSIDGYAVASWPPSGIALASFLLFGYRAVFGVLIGAMLTNFCLLYTSPSPRDVEESRMPSSA